MSFSICGTSGQNTGKIGCDRRRAIPKKIIIGGKAFDASDYADTATFDEALQDAINLETGNSNKIYPFPEITGVTDATEASVESTLGGYGPKITLIEGKPSYTFDMVCGIEQEKSLRAFNGQQVPVFIVEDGVIWGRMNSSDEFVGTDCLIHTTPHKIGDGQNGQTTKVSISFVNAADFYDSAAWMLTDLSASDIEGLVDAQLVKVSNASNVYKIGIEVPTGQAGGSINVYDSYSSELASSALWSAGTGTGYDTPLAITSVAVDATLEAWTVTLDSTAYSALSSGAKIELRLDDPATLQAAGVTGMEGVAVILTK